MLPLGTGVLLPLGAYYRPRDPPPTVLDEAANVTVVGILEPHCPGKFCETSVKGTKKLKRFHFFSEHFSKKGRLFLLVESNYLNREKGNEITIILIPNKPILQQG